MFVNCIYILTFDFRSLLHNFKIHPGDYQDNFKCYTGCFDPNFILLKNM